MPNGINKNALHRLQTTRKNTHTNTAPRVPFVSTINKRLGEKLNPVVKEVKQDLPAMTAEELLEGLSEFVFVGGKRKHKKRKTLRRRRLTRRL